MKLRMTVELTRIEGTPGNPDREEVVEELRDAVDAIEVWCADTGYDVAVVLGPE